MKKPLIFYFDTKYWMLVTGIDNKLKPPQPILQFWTSQNPTTDDPKWKQLIHSFIYLIRTIAYIHDCLH